MSYDLTFVRRCPDQTWAEVLDDQDDEFASPDPEVWQRVVQRATQLLGEVSLFTGEHFAEIDHEPTHIQLSLSTDRAEMHAPYGASGTDAAATLKAMYLLGAIVEQEAGLEGYDPQVDKPLAESAADLGLGLASFEAVAHMIRQHPPS